MIHVRAVNINIGPVDVVGQIAGHEGYGMGYVGYLTDSSLGDPFFKFVFLSTWYLFLRTLIFLES